MEGQVLGAERTGRRHLAAPARRLVLGHRQSTAVRTTCKWPFCQERQPRLSCLEIDRTAEWHHRPDRTENRCVDCPRSRELSRACRRFLRLPRQRIDPSCRYRWSRTPASRSRGFPRYAHSNPSLFRHRFTILRRNMELSNHPRSNCNESQDNRWNLQDQPGRPRDMRAASSAGHRAGTDTQCARHVRYQQPGPRSHPRPIAPADPQSPAIHPQMRVPRPPPTRANSPVASCRHYSE